MSTVIVPGLSPNPSLGCHISSCLVQRSSGELKSWPTFTSLLAWLTSVETGHPKPPIILDSGANPPVTNEGFRVSTYEAEAAHDLFSSPTTVQFGVVGDPLMELGWDAILIECSLPPPRAASTVRVRFPFSYTPEAYGVSYLSLAHLFVLEYEYDTSKRNPCIMVPAGVIVRDATCLPAPLWALVMSIPTIGNNPAGSRYRLTVCRVGSPRLHAALLGLGYRPHWLPDPSVSASYKPSTT